ncbi:MAG: hypothetical protein PHC46_04830 [Clostridia bacterium]|nr:hypothetical protein [Clostridia bacterium]
MGTRNLTMVINKASELKVAQYGQWDGYPSGNGIEILEFCRNKDNLTALKNSLEKCIFYNDDKGFIEKYDNAVDKKTLTPQQSFWFNNFQSRNVGANILHNITYCDFDKLGESQIKLYNDKEFGQDSLMCEYAYCVNFNTNKLMCFSGFNTDKEKEHEFFITKQEEVDKEFKRLDCTKYYGIILVKEYDLNNLPSKEKFLEDLEENDDAESNDDELLF